jgi:AraC-like DNA-binding protein
MSDSATRPIANALNDFLGRGGVNCLYVAGGTIIPPALAYLVSFPRLSIVLSGHDRMDIELNSQLCEVDISARQAVLVPPNCWNNPAWSGRVSVLTFLFGKRQTGISLVSHRNRDEPATALKAHFHRPLEGPLPGMLDALMSLPTDASEDKTACLLTEAILHSCLRLLEEPAHGGGGKAQRTYQNICLYVQEHFYSPLTRESVAEHFGLSPNHVSRLFRAEGLMRFTDYLTWVRLDRAKFMLRHHDRKLADIARSCGFSEVGYFCRVFKQKAKMTPSAYREQGGVHKMQDDLTA